MRKYAQEHAPLRRNSSGTEVGELAAFLSSDVASSITGQTLFGTCKLVSLDLTIISNSLQLMAA